MKLLFKKIVFLFCFFLTSYAQGNQSFDFTVVRTLPILDQGRIKPFDTFARESVQRITGKIYFQGIDPIQTILTWVADPEKAIHEPILLARFEPLNKKVGITAQNGRISPNDLVNLQEFKNYLKGIMVRQQEGESLQPIEKEATELYGRLDLFQRIVSGAAFALVPEPNGESWSGVNTLTDQKIAEQFKSVLNSLRANDSPSFLSASLALKGSLSEAGRKTAHYPNEREMNLEVGFNQIRPFQKAWVFFLISFVLVLLSLGSKKKWLYSSSLVFGALGILISIYGFVCRSLIAGRPPVSNMYESVIWVSFGAMIFALIFEAIYRSRYFLLSGAAGATIGLILADNLPNVLSSHIQPLVPVLRSNMWLTIHVLTITLSYAAFLLAMGVGQMAIGYYAFRPGETDRQKSLTLFIYRAIQVGVVLLAAGTILGGVWANYSWGRFWGWDPKEVWALIALLGYLAILHGRYAGWLQGFGMAVWSVLAFLLVLMAWYGVNFVLGVGLHSYGFSSGGFTGVIVFVGIQLVWVLFATIRFKMLHSSIADQEVGGR